jgi:hypothetical protein
MLPRSFQKSPSFKFLLEAINILSSCAYLESLSFVRREKYDMERIINVVSRSSSTLKKKQVGGFLRVVDKEHSFDEYKSEFLMDYHCHWH